MNAKMTQYSETRTLRCASDTGAYVYDHYLQGRDRRTDDMIRHVLINERMVDNCEYKAMLVIDILSCSIFDTVARVHSCPRRLYILRRPGEPFSKQENIRDYTSYEMFRVARSNFWEMRNINFQHRSTNHRNVFITTLGCDPQMRWCLRYSFVMNGNIWVKRATILRGARQAGLGVGLWIWADGRMALPLCSCVKL